MESILPFGKNIKIPTIWKVVRYMVYKGNLKPHFIMTLEVLLWDLKGTVPSPFKVTTRNHSHTFRTNRSEITATRSYIANDLNLQGWSWNQKLKSLYC